MTTETQELKACWCCNAPALLERDGDHHGEWFNLGCSRHWEAVPDRAEACPAGRIWYTADPDELEAAITAWNTRPREAELEAEVERLREALKDCADDLEAEILARANSELPRRIDRDLETVRVARQALSPNNPAGQAMEGDHG